MEKGVFGEVEYEKVCDLILIFTTSSCMKIGNESLGHDTFIFLQSASPMRYIIPS